MNEFLTPTELQQLTEKRRPADQVAALEKLGVPVRTAPTGRPIVSREHVRAWLAGGQLVAARAPRLDLVR